MSDGQAKVAIVTGSGRGIGRACALDLARHGFDIAPVDLIEDDLARTAAEIRELGRKALTFIADVSDHARAAEIAAEVDRQWGRIDGLCRKFIMMLEAARSSDAIMLRAPQRL